VRVSFQHRSSAPLQHQVHVSGRAVIKTSQILSLSLSSELQPAVSESVRHDTVTKSSKLPPPIRPRIRSSSSSSSSSSFVLDCNMRRHTIAVLFIIPLFGVFLVVALDLVGVEARRHGRHGPTPFIDTVDDDTAIAAPRRTSGSSPVVQQLSYISADCSGVGSSQWATNGTCQAHGDGTGATRFSCLPSGSIQLTWYRTKDCSDAGQDEQVFEPGQCIDDGGSKKKSEDRQQQLDVFASRSDPQGSRAYWCVPPSIVPAAYGPANADAAITWFSNSACSWDSFVDQHELELGGCSSIVMNDGGFYHVIYLIMNSCDQSPSGVANYTMFADAECTTEVQKGVIPTACGKGGGPPNVWAQVQCKLPSTRQNRNLNYNKVEERERMP
jgi:hypothetical protein